MKKIFIAFLAFVLAGLPLAVGATGVQSGDYRQYPNPVGITDASVIIGNIIKGVLSIVGTLAILMVVLGGWNWLTAMGNQDKINKGKNILTWTTISLLIIFSAYIVVRYAFELVGAVKQ